jgi:hypothetical protein
VLLVQLESKVSRETKAYRAKPEFMDSVILDFRVRQVPKETLESKDRLGQKVLPA